MNKETVLPDARAMLHSLRHFLTLGFVCMLTFGQAAAAATLEDLLARTDAPPGVVFEIVDRDSDALDVSLPWVADAAARLKARFPGVPMALVTHGQEMFALQARTREARPDVHALAERLTRDEGVAVHVCETYAERRGLAAEDFPDYVDVAPEGPAQIRNYEALDYVRVVVPRAAVLRQRGRN